MKDSDGSDGKLHEVIDVHQDDKDSDGKLMMMFIKKMIME